MSNVARVAGQAANTLSKPLNVEDVFSTYLYEGNGSTQTITNGIDLDGEGGLVWAKSRGTADGHFLFDTERGATKRLRSHATNAENTDSTSLTSFNSNGFSIGSSASLNNSAGTEYASWTFRKAPKFFDVVTYTGTGAAQSISHNLGSVPGMIVVKRTDNTSDWNVYHRESHNFPANNFLRMNLTNAIDADFDIWNATVPTDAVFSVGSSTKTNVSGATYVAYLFAHNDGDGEFGDGTQDIIKCGSFTDNGSTVDVNLGFEPQFVLVKSSSDANSWVLVDTMRGAVVGGNDAGLYANLTNTEINNWNLIEPTPTGFKYNSGILSLNGWDLIYIAIRRGPMGIPESASEVFDVQTAGNLSGLYSTSTGFTPDTAFYRDRDSTQNNIIQARLTETQLITNSTASEFTSYNSHLAGNQDGIRFDSTQNYGSSIIYQWRRAPSFFDVVAYTGNGTAGRTVSHNLGVAPEMMWIKKRNAAAQWAVYHSAITADKFMHLDSTDGANAGGSVIWNGTEPTSSVFTVGDNDLNNVSSGTYIAYLFASLDGVSKVGSYTGDGTTDGSNVVDCGFSSGARFILVKRYDVSGGNWGVFDTERGITSGSDPRLFLSTTDAETTGIDFLVPTSSGFAFKAGFNTSGANYIFYAIA
jgi:hypothetical protein